MEKWQQCKDLSKFCRTENNKDPNAPQQWQQGRSKFSAECCWSINDPDLKDYDKEVTIKTKDIYKKGLEDGKYNELETKTQWEAHYRMIIPLKTKRDVMIKMTFEISKVEDGVTSKDIEQTKQYISKISKIWNGNFSLQVTDTRNKCCDPITLPIVFDIQFAHAGEKIANGEKTPHTIELYNKVPHMPGEDEPRPFLLNGKTFILEKDPSKYNTAFTYAHEFGHALGLPDEYGYDTITNSIVQYYKINGSLDKSKYLAFHKGKVKSLEDPNESIMGSPNSCTLTERQGWAIGIAAQKIIDEKQKRYQCNILYHGNKHSCSFL